MTTEQLDPKDQETTGEDLSECTAGAPLSEEKEVEEETVPAEA